jgi:hypothetical protein
VRTGDTDPIKLTPTPTLERKKELHTPTLPQERTVATTNHPRRYEKNDTKIIQAPSFHSTAPYRLHNHPHKKPPPNFSRRIPPTLTPTPTPVHRRRERKACIMK